MMGCCLKGKGKPLDRIKLEAPFEKLLTQISRTV